jgi:hypothetical protein
MKTGVIFALTIGFTIHIFAEPTVRYSGIVRDPSGAPAVGGACVFLLNVLFCN